MHHKKGKPPHGRGGPKWNKPWKLGRFGRSNRDAESFGNHRRRTAADREMDEPVEADPPASRRLFKLVHPGPLVPTGAPVEIIHHDGGTEQMQPLAPESETLLGYLRLHHDGTLSYEEIRPNEEQDPAEILERVHDILGLALRATPPGGQDDPFRRFPRPRQGEVAARMLNFIHSMGNHLATLQWRELDAADRE